MRQSTSKILSWITVDLCFLSAITSILPPHPHTSTCDLFGEAMALLWLKQAHVPNQKAYKTLWGALGDKGMLSSCSSVQWKQILVQYFESSIMNTNRGEVKERKDCPLKQGDELPQWQQSSRRRLIQLGSDLRYWFALENLFGLHRCKCSSCEKPHIEGGGGQTVW